MAEGNINEEMGLMIKRVRKALGDTGKKEINKGISRGWWDEECNEKKEVRKQLRKWRKENSSGKNYRKKKKE